MVDFKGWYKQHDQLFFTLAQEVTHVLSHNIHQQGIVLHTLQSRIKPLKSCNEKIRRKKYDDPINQLQDIVGIKIILLFPSDVNEIESIVKSNFHLVSREHKQTNIDQFSYNAQHFVVRMKQKNTKHFKETKNLSVEIQVRTILQEAWSEMEHYLNYKKVGVDPIHQRKIHQLSAILELADQQFDALATEYKSSTSKDIVKKNTINTTLLYHYAQKEFNWTFDTSVTTHDFEPCLQLAQKLGIQSIKEIHSIVLKHKNDIAKEEELHIETIKNNPTQWPTIIKRINEHGHFYLPNMFIQLALQKEVEKRLH